MEDPATKPASSRRWARLPWTAAIAYAVLLAYLLLAPYPWWFLGATGEDIDEALSRDVADYLQHAGVFALLAVLTGLAQAASRRPQRAWCILATVTYAIATEGLQAFIPNRFAGLRDALANFAGLLIGWLIVIALTEALSKKSRGRDS